MLTPGSPIGGGQLLTLPKTWLTLPPPKGFGVGKTLGILLLEIKFNSEKMDFYLKMGQIRE